MKNISLRYRNTLKMQKYLKDIFHFFVNKKCTEYKNDTLNIKTINIYKYI